MVHSRPITLEEMKECLAAQGTELKSGDIVLLRTGFVGAVSRLTQEQQVQLAATGHVQAAGVKQGDDVLAWLWDSQFVSPRLQKLTQLPFFYSHKCGLSLLGRGRIRYGSVGMRPCSYRRAYASEDPLRSGYDSR